MWMLIVPAGFVALFLLVYGMVSYFNPTYVKEVEKDVRDPSTGTITKQKVPTEVWSPFGTTVDVLGLVLIPLLAICVLLLVVRSDTLVQSRLSLWRMFGVTNPDGAHAVLDAPDDLVVKDTEGEVKFVIPEGVDPLWAIVTVRKGMESPDSLVVPLSSLTSNTVTFKHAKVKTADSVKVMYGTATGPSAEAEWTKVVPASTYVPTAEDTCCDDPST